MIGYIIFFCLCLIFYLLYVVRHKRDNILLIILISFYLVSALISIWHFCNGPESYKELSLFSYIILFISIIVAFHPISGFHPKRYTGVKLINYQNSTIIALVLILLFLPSLIMIIPSLISDYKGIMIDFAFASEMYDETADMAQSQTGRSFSNIGSVFRGAFAEVIVFYSFYYALYQEKNKTISILLWLCMLYPLLTSFRQGSRTMMSWWLLEVLISFVLFKGFYKEEVKKRINRIVYSFVIVVSLVFVVLTIGRFATGMYANDSQVENSLVSYSGQSTLNFSDDIIQNDVYQYGDNCFPLFRRLIGLESSGNLYERQSKWSSSMKIRQGAFYTFMGDIYCDFSPFFGFVFILLISTFLFAIINRYEGKRISSSKIFLVFFCSCLLFNGLFYFSYKGIGGNLRIIVNVMFIIMLNILSSKKSNVNV